LAAQLNTNTKYLSEAIKNNRSQNFNNYINNLRINYIVHKLYNDPKYREYKISWQKNVAMLPPRFCDCIQKDQRIDAFVFHPESKR
jgi:YesN/AraC family two-component response regulator